MLRDGWVSNKWILPPNYWMTIWHEAKMLMNHLSQFYRTVIDIFTSYWRDVTKVSQVVGVTRVSKSIFLYHATLLPLILFLAEYCSESSTFFSHWKLTTCPNQIARHPKSDHALKTSTVFTFPTTDTYNCFVNVWIPNTPVKNMYWMANGCKSKS